MASLNPFSPDFKLVACDGPAALNYKKDPKTGMFVKDADGSYMLIDSTYVPCDFSGLMVQTQHLINAMVIIGVLAAIVSFTYAGALLIWSGPEKRNRAKDIFKKVGIGFIMMLTAWFIVFQILDWLASDSGVKVLLGNP